MQRSPTAPFRGARWGKPPWKIDFRPPSHHLPAHVDLAVVGGGFTGLAAAAWLRRLAPRASVAVFEAGNLGAGASGHTGGLTLAETAAGDLPGLGDVLAGFSRRLTALQVDCDLHLPGVYELSHAACKPHSPICWKDEGGGLRVFKRVAGGSIDPGKLVSGLARAAHRLGVEICENAPVAGISFGPTLRLLVNGTRISAGHALLATNAMSLDLNGLEHRAEPKFTLAVATEPLSTRQLAALGLASRRPFYTVDLPYLWGRLLENNSLVLGCGLVHLENWSDLRQIDVAKGESARLIARLIRRVRGFHPALGRVRFTHRWGGPILMSRKWKPVFERHRHSPNVLVLGAYTGHGVALSTYLGCWAAEVLLKKKSLPAW
jgi:glycine/D-amino acid oxidase-like deaminating enzyme